MIAYIGAIGPDGLIHGPSLASVMFCHRSEWLFWVVLAWSGFAYQLTDVLVVA